MHVEATRACFDAAAVLVEEALITGGTVRGRGPVTAVTVRVTQPTAATRSACNVTQTCDMRYSLG